MQIEYIHASKYGNGAKVAEEFKKSMSTRDVVVNVHHVREVRPHSIAQADLYLFSSPGRMGRPIGSMRRFLKRVRLPVGTKYAILTTEFATMPDKKTGRMPTEEEVAKWHRIIPTMTSILNAKGLTDVAEGKILVTGVSGPLEDGWEEKVHDFVDKLFLLTLQSN